MKLPSRNSLVSQTVSIIEEMIQKGELHSPLPGERKLAARLHIGRDTLRSALNELERRKWISPSNQGSRRMILKTDCAIKEENTTRRVGFISPKPLEELPRNMLIELDALRAILAKQDTTLEILTPAVFNTAHPEKRLQQFIQDNQADAWLLYRCTREIQTWFAQQQLPCIIRGYPQPGVHLPYLDEDWKAAAYHVGTQLLKKGHTNVALIVPNQSLQGLKAAEEGLREAYDYVSDKCKVEILVEKGEKDSVIHSIQKGLSQNSNITALIVTRPRQILNTITWLASHRLHVPEHISLVALCYESWFSELIPTINHYKISHIKMAAALARRLDSLMQGSSLDNYSSFVIPEEVPGQSVKNLTS